MPPERYFRVANDRGSRQRLNPGLRIETWGTLQPKQPQHFWQKPGCGPSLGVLGSGVVGTVLTAGAIAGAFIFGPEELVGFEGAMTIIHVAPVGVPGVLIMGQGVTGVVQNCF